MAMAVNLLGDKGENEGDEKQHEKEDTPRQ